MKYPKTRIKLRKRVYDIVESLVRNALELDLKYPAQDVASIAAVRISAVVANNYRRRRK
jgi:hypothetical protein